MERSKAESISKANGYIPVNFDPIMNDWYLWHNGQAYYRENHIRRALKGKSHATHQQQRQRTA